MLLGTLEVGLSDGNSYQQIDMLGKGSIIGQNYLLVSLQWLYRVAVKSLSAFIFIIERNSLLIEMENNKLLTSEVRAYEEKLAVEGVPHIDYVCNFEQIDRSEMLNIVKNFKKSQLWRMDKHQEIEQFDVLYKDYVDNVCQIGNLHRFMVSKATTSALLGF